MAGPAQWLADALIAAGWILATAVIAGTTCRRSAATNQPSSVHAGSVPRSTGMPMTLIQWHPLPSDDGGTHGQTTDK